MLLIYLVPFVEDALIALK